MTIMDRHSSDVNIRKLSEREEFVCRNKGVDRSKLV